MVTMAKYPLTCSVIFSDLSNFALQPSGLLIFLHVLFALQPGRGIQHDVLNLVLNIFSPGCKPGNLKYQLFVTIFTLNLESFQL